MYIPKRYGQAKLDACPFCGKQATLYNAQKLPVCVAHRQQTLPNIKCACGRWLELMHGKWGSYFLCGKCGTINLRKALVSMPQHARVKPDVQTEKQTARKEQSVRVVD